MKTTVPTKSINSLFLSAFFFCISIIVFNFSNAQVTKRPKRADSTQLGKKNADLNTAIENKLVDLALKGPRYIASEHQNKINEYELKKTKNSWLDLLSLSMNYNDQTFSKVQQTAYVYPKYFFGLSIPLGIIFSKGTEIKSAREAVAYSKSNQEQLARDIKADILSKYRQYKAYTELILLQSELVNDEQAALTKSEERFKSDQLSIELYNAAQKIYNDEVSRKINLQLQQDLIKIEIEKAIGIRLEDAIAQAINRE